MQKDFYLDPRMVGKKKIYYVKFRDPVTRVILTARSSEETNKTRAENWARDIYSEMSKYSNSSDISLREWAKPFFQPKGCPHKEKLIDEKKPFGEKTRRDYLRYLENDILTNEIADRRISDIDRPDLVKFRARLISKRGRCRSAHLVFRVLCILLRDAVHYGKRNTDPTALLGGIAYEEKTRKAVDKKAIKKLFKPENWEDPVSRRAALTAFYSGPRAGEIISLKWGVISKKKHLIAIIANHTDLDGDKLPKWEKCRTSTYPKPLEVELEPFRGKPDDWVFSVEDGIRLSYKTLYKHMKKAAKKAGLEGLSLHGLRHSGQNILRENGVNDELLRASYGWVDKRTQEKYTHRDLFNLKPVSDAVNRIFGEKPADKGEIDGTDKERDGQVDGED